jgi:hypothetical protein
VRWDADRSLTIESLRRAGFVVNETPTTKAVRSWINIERNGWKAVIYFDEANRPNQIIVSPPAGSSWQAAVGRAEARFGRAVEGIDKATTRWKAPSGAWATAAISSERRGFRYVEEHGRGIAAGAVGMGPEKLRGLTWGGNEADVRRTLEGAGFVTRVPPQVPDPRPAPNPPPESARGDTVAIEYEHLNEQGNVVVSRARGLTQVTFVSVDNPTRDSSLEREGRVGVAFGAPGNDEDDEASDTRVFADGATRVTLESTVYHYAPDKPGQPESISEVYVPLRRP